MEGRWRHKVRLHVNNLLGDRRGWTTPLGTHVEWSTTTMNSFTKPNNMCVNVGVWLSSESLRERVSERERERQNDGK